MAIKKLSLEELGRKSLNDFKVSEKYPIVLVLDNIRSAFNVGSIFRTADAFLVEKIWLVGTTPTPEDQHSTIHKTALDASLSVEWAYSTNEELPDHLLAYRARDYQIAVLEQTSSSVLLQEFRFASTSKKLVLICGNEIEGVRQSIVDMADTHIEIPQEGTKHSLNVGVATAIALWQIRQERYRT